MAIHVDCDLNGPSVPLRQPWRFCVGSCHAPTGLRADWQAQLRQAREDLGFEYVRFHGILSDDMGTLVCRDKQLVYSFFNADQVFDYLLSLGMRPIVELSFMPLTLASGSNTVFSYRANITPPRDMAQWSELIHTLAAHWVQRYGIEEVSRWYFEVWNEPNLKIFWSGSQQAYFDLYTATAKALKDVGAGLRVGGPATAQNAWLDEFIAFCKERKLPLDFISTHFYPTDAGGETGASPVSQLQHAPLDVMRERALAARRQAGSLPVLYTEWNITSQQRDPLRDSSFAAALAVRIAMSVDEVVDAYSYWTFSDIFEESHFPSQPFHGGFGLLSLHGIKKPVYKAFELMAALGDRHYPLAQSHASVVLWVGEQSYNPAEAHILCINQAMPRHAIQAEEIAVSLQNPAGRRAKTVKLQRIDEDNGNPALLWQQMGRPDYLSPAQVAALQQATVLLETAAEFTTQDKQTLISFQAAAQSVSFLRIEWEHLNEVQIESESAAAASLALQSAERLV
ncbi:MAG: glycosyl hydrolase [Pseudomonadota bacterium]